MTSKEYFCTTARKKEFDLVVIYFIYMYIPVQPYPKTIFTEKLVLVRHHKNFIVLSHLLCQDYTNFLCYVHR